MNVFIVVIFYNPTEEQTRRFAILSKSYNVVAVDNSNKKLHYKSLRELIYIPLLENRGIASATNIGIEYSIEKGATHVIIFDQDSKIDVVFIDRYIEEYIKILELHKNENFILGPKIHNLNDKRTKRSLEKNNFQIQSSIIASGMFASINVFKKVGKMDELFFIDLVDTEYCWRAKSLGIKIFVANKIKLFHVVGEKHTTILNFPIITSSPFRYYYKCRNYVWLSQKTYTPNSWKLKRLIRILFEILWYCCHGNIEIVRNSIKGFRDGYAK